MRSLQTQAGLGEPSSARRTYRERDPEVRYQWLALREEDVRGFDVPVNHAPLMSSLKRTCHLGGNRDRLIDGQLLVAVDALS